MNNLEHLLTWLHNGTTVDRIFFWRKLIRQQNEKVSGDDLNTLLSLKNSLKFAMDENYDQSKCSISVQNSLIDFIGSSNVDNLDKDNGTLKPASEDDTTSVQDVFDPEIPDVTDVILAKDFTKDNDKIDDKYSESESSDTDDEFAAMLLGEKLHTN